jgi:hypothetical protein
VTTAEEANEPSTEQEFYLQAQRTLERSLLITWGWDKKASAAAWIVLVSRSRSGVILPAVAPPQPIPDNVSSRTPCGGGRFPRNHWRAPALYRITGHYPIVSWWSAVR